MRKPIALISNDWHLKRSNLDDILRLVRQKCQLAKDKGLKMILCLGDVFESRISQRMDVLNTFYQILEICKEYDLILVCIPGNHDKTDYELEESFLRPFMFHPSLHLIEDYATFRLAGYNFHFIPYFSENGKYWEYLNKVEYKGDDLLFSHIAVKGSRNNDGTLIENELTIQKFNKFIGVFLGHYHNFQKLDDSFYHLPSIQQNNFGEDQNKGFTLLYDDLSIEIIKGDSKRYISVPIDMDQGDFKTLNKVIDRYDPKKDHVRLILEGSEDKIKSLDVTVLQEKGFVVKAQQKEVQANISALRNAKVIKYNMDHMITLFKTFCEQRNLNYPEGIEHLKNTISEASFSSSGVNQ